MEVVACLPLIRGKRGVVYWRCRAAGCKTWMDIIKNAGLDFGLGRFRDCRSIFLVGRSTGLPLWASFTSWRLFIYHGWAGGCERFLLLSLATASVSLLPAMQLCAKHGFSFSYLGVPACIV